jgi:hypothetical protein
MKLVIAAACLVVSLALASHALADGRSVLTLQQPLPKHVDFIVNGAIWNCDGATCTAAVDSQTLGVQQCHTVALHVGPVASAVNSGKGLQPAQLDACNHGIAPKPTIASAH